MGAYRTVPSRGSTHHVGLSSMRYSRDEPLEYVSSPMNLEQGQLTWFSQTHLKPWEH
jgi:hypothetical protein